MKKLVIFTFLFLSTLLVNANPIYASEIINQPKDKKVINIIDNKDIQSVNSKLEKTRVITQKNLAEIKELSNVKINKSDNKKVELFIENKKPDRIVEYDDGSKVAYYASSIVYCNYDETYNDYNVELYVRMYYAKWVLDDWYECTRLITGYGKLVDCYENGYRNLIITCYTGGAYDNPDGTHGTSSYNGSSNVITSPTLGKLYSQNSYNNNYYCTGTGLGIIKVDVSVQWRHGTKWYTTTHAISLGGI